jgi:hypothetical protein
MSAPDGLAGKGCFHRRAVSSMPLARCTNLSLGDGADVPRFCRREVERAFRRVECLLTIAGLFLTRGGQPSAGAVISGRRRLNYRADRLHPSVGRCEPADAGYRVWDINSRSDHGTALAGRGVARGSAAAVVALAVSMDFLACLDGSSNSATGRCWRVGMEDTADAWGACEEGSFGLGAEMGVVRLGGARWIAGLKPL